MNKNFLALVFVFLISLVSLSLTQNALAGSATVSWNANTEPDLAGYRIYYGTSPRSGTCPTGGYPSVVNVGNVTTYTFNNLTDGATYYFSVTAYDNATPANESVCSAEVNKLISPAVDTTPPTVNVFTIPATSASLTVSITTLTATDNSGTVTGYLVNESATTPSALAGGWTATAPTSYTATSAGSKTLYAWAKDAANNVSVSRSATITITLPVSTLTISLTAAPSSGNAPLNGVSLAATVGGTATGNINYTFYCNRSDGGTNIITPYDAKYDNQTATSITATNACNYTNAGTYTAKVITERGGLQAENRTTIIVSQTQSTKFQIGNMVYVSSGPLNVRAAASASATLLGTQPTNALGSVVGGPTYSDGYWWWQINYDSGVDGWSTENFLEIYTPAAITNLNFIPSSESVTNISGKQFVITIFQSGSQVAQFSAAPNLQNQIPLPTSITNLMPGNYDIYADTGQHLKGKITNASLSSGATITLPTLKSGDINDDGIINSLDWSTMNTNWFTTNIINDINRDGIVNSLDFSWMNKNWLQADAI